MTHYSIEPRTRKYVKGYEFLSFATNLSNKHWKNLLVNNRETGLNPARTASKRSHRKQNSW